MINWNHILNFDENSVPVVSGMLYSYSLMLDPHDTVILSKNRHGLWHIVCTHSREDFLYVNKEKTWDPEYGDFQKYTFTSYDYTTFSTPEEAILAYKEFLQQFPLRTEVKVGDFSYCSYRNCSVSDAKRSAGLLYAAGTWQIRDLTTGEIIP